MRGDTLRHQPSRSRHHKRGGPMTRFRVLVIGMLAGLLAACGTAQEGTRKPQGEPRPKIGLLMDTLKEGERWQRDRDLFLERAKELRADVLVESAEGDAAKQQQ